MTTFAQNSVPSFLTRQPSSSNTPVSVATFEFVLGQSACERFGGVEARKVLADDLVGSVSLEALGAGVPGENVAVGIQHENRIVPHALDEQPEALLALLQVSFLLAAVH